MVGPSSVKVAELKYLTHFYRGWDWGPVLNTCGPWRQVRLETYQARIADIRVNYEVAATLGSVSGSIVVSVEGNSGKTVNVTASTFDGDTPVFKGTAEVSDDGTARVEFHINDPKLWYPHGYGSQTLYNVKASIYNDDGELDNAIRRIGFRKAELIQRPDEIGKTFFFRVNGIDVFCGGSDWIPADSFTPRITEDRYRRWLQMMVDGYQLMIR